MELETHLIIATRVGIASKSDAKPGWDLAQEVGKMLTVMISRMRHSSPIVSEEEPDYTLNAVSREEARLFK